MTIILRDERPQPKVSLNNIGTQFIKDYVGDIFRLAREAKGWTMDQLAEETGLTKITILSVENKRTIPTTVTLYRLCFALDIEMTDVLPSVENVYDEILSWKAEQS